MGAPAGSKSQKTVKCASSSCFPDSDQAVKVRVVVRIRPFIASERASSEEDPIPCITLVESDESSGDEITVRIKDQQTSRNDCYKLDSFYGQDSSLEEIFQTEVCPVIPGLFQGCNATVFAYGATGSGKTYSMQGTDEQPGIMPLAMNAILFLCNSTGWSAEISYLEIYMERCYDLLEAGVKEIAVLDNKDGRIQLKGLSQVRVHSMSEFYEVFSLGLQRRKVAQTRLNHLSSRSHGVLMIAVSCPSEASGGINTGKLNLIDLAGNEDNRRSCNEGVRLQESAAINQSLFALSNVIYALNNNKPYVPFRDSKLTRILQDSLGGTSRSLMIACLNPISYQEAVNTVSLAARSRHIVNLVSCPQKQETPGEKVDMKARLAAWLETKGKTKSAKKLGAPCSPYLGKTPLALSTLKKPNLNVSFAKEKLERNVALCPKERQRIGCGLLKTSVTEEFIPQEPQQPKDISDVQHEEGTRTFAGESCGNEDREKNANLFYTDEEENPKYLQELSNCLRERVSGKENMETPEQDFVILPSISERIKALKSSIKKVLSPVDSNSSTPPGDICSSDDQLCVLMFKPKTPKTRLVLINDKGSPTTKRSPLDRFTSSASNIKSSLLQEYLSFLNTASREELMGLKGIGQKRADSIMKLRETSPCPIKSLSDLEKIGLSSKQAEDMFRKTARGIFS